MIKAAGYIKKLGKVSDIETARPAAKGPVATSIISGVEIIVPLAGVIDVEVEKTRAHQGNRACDRASGAGHGQGRQS